MPRCLVPNRSRFPGAILELPRKLSHDTLNDEVVQGIQVSLQSSHRQMRKHTISITNHYLAWDVFRRTGYEYASLEELSSRTCSDHADVRRALSLVVCPPLVSGPCRSPLSFCTAFRDAVPVDFLVWMCGRHILSSSFAYGYLLAAVHPSPTVSGPRISSLVVSKVRRNSQRFRNSRMTIVRRRTLA